MIKKVSILIISILVLTSCSMTAGQPASSDGGASSRLAAVLAEMDESKGIHFCYDVNTEGTDTMTTNDVYALDGKYYSRTYVGEETDFDNVQYSDGNTMILLDMSNKTGAAGPIPSGMDGKTGIELDGLFELMLLAADTDHRDKQVEIKGEKYSCEIFAATADTVTEKTAYFNKDGELIRFVSAGDEKDGISAVTYYINIIDDDVDPGIFDISGYRVTEGQ